MKRLLLGLAVALAWAASTAEAGKLPPNAVSRIQRAKQITRLHDYLQRSTKYTSSEWGSAALRNLKILPVNPHPYVTGRIGF